MGGTRDVTPPPADRRRNSIVWLVVLLIAIFGVFAMALEGNDGRTYGQRRVAEIKEGCAREFPIPSEAMACELQLSIEELEKDRAARLDRARR